MELLSPSKPITELVDLVIEPYIHLNPSFGIVISTDATLNEKYYANSIVELAKKYNIDVEIAEGKNIPEAGLAITKFKRNPKVQGIINLSNFGEATQNLNDTIPPRLDVNAYSSLVKGKLVTSDGQIGFRRGPCGAAAGVKILQYEGIDFEKKRIAVIGRDIQVGRPLAEMLCQQGASITVFNKNLENIDLSRFDVVYNTVKQRNFITSSFWKNGFEHLEYLIDIGANASDNGTTQGSIKLDDFKDVDCKIATLVGCIDQLTIMILFTKIYTNAAIMSGELL